MAMSGVYNMLKDAGSRVLHLTEGQPWVKHSLDYIHDHPWTLLGAAAGAVVVWKLATMPRNLPPGPRNLPFFGATEVWRPKLGTALLEMKSTYGDIIYMKKLGSHNIFLNSMKVIREAFTKRPEDFSHRTSSYFMIYSGMSGDEVFTAPFDEQWKANKKFAVTSLKNCGFGTAKSQAKILNGLGKFDDVIRNKDGQPFSVQDSVNGLACSMVFSIYFDQDLSLNDPKILRIQELSSLFNEAIMEGFYLCEVILPDWPFLRRLVCKSSLNKARSSLQSMETIWLEMVREHKDTFDPSEIRDIIDYYIAKRDHLDEKVITANITLIVPDAIDTTSVLALWVLFYITKHKDVQEKLQQDIDEVCSMDKNISLADKKNLPYAEAIVLESLRCADLITVGQPRIMKRKIEFEGFTFPKGAVVRACNRSVHHDPEVFPDPTKFDPTRFLDSTGKVNPSMAGQILTFGIGTRMCLGESYAKYFAYMFLVHIAQKYIMTFDPSQPAPPLGTGESLRPPPVNKMIFTPR